MTDRPNPLEHLESLNDHDLLLLLDLAAEVIEGLDQLGVATRDEVEALMVQIERRIAEQA